jgi:hypothetical protein
MKRLLATMLLVGALAGPAAADPGIEEEYDDAITHPLRLAAYLAHPVGFAVEWLVGRPFHYLISRPDLSRVFGYQSPEAEKSAFRYGDHL